MSGLKEGDTIVLPQGGAGSNRIPGMGGVGGTNMFRQTPAR